MVMELDRRENESCEVVLSFDDSFSEVLIDFHDRITDRWYQISPGVEKAQDAFQHPFAYVDTYGFPLSSERKLVAFGDVQDFLNGVGLEIAT